MLIGEDRCPRHTNTYLSESRCGELSVSDDISWSMSIQDLQCARAEPPGCLGGGCEPLHCRRRRSSPHYYSVRYANPEGDHEFMDRVEVSEVLDRCMRTLSINDPDDGQLAHQASARAADRQLSPRNEAEPGVVNIVQWNDIQAEADGIAERDCSRHCLWATGSG